jgi:predicted Fe-Mo cluster-binding NifX family protein
MKISVAVIGNQARSLIPENLRQATHLFIVDTERFEVLRILTADEPMDRDVAFARRTIDENCEAIICGEIEERAFELLAAACVSRYNGTGHHASQATKLIKAYQLPLIREYIGGPGCAGERSGGECHESSLE